MFKNVAWLLSEKLSRLLITVLVTGVMARHLGAEQIGSLNHGLALAALAAFFVNQGLDQLAVRQVLTAKTKEDAAAVLAGIVLLRGVGFLLGALIVTIWCFAVGFWQDRQIAVLALIYISSYFGFMGDAADVYFQSQMKNRLSALSRQLGLWLGSGARLLLVFFNAPLEWFAAAQIIDSGVYIVTQYVQIRRLQIFEFHFRQWWSMGFQAVKQLIQEGWPLLGVSFCVLLYSRFDQVLLGHLGAHNELGQYTLALRVLDYANVFPMVLMTSSFPLIVAQCKGQGDLSSSKTLVHLVSALTLAVFGAALLSWQSPLVIDILYGQDFKTVGVDILKIVAWLFPLTFFGVLRQAVFTAQGTLKTALAVELCALFLILMLDMYYIPREGAVGAAKALLYAAIVHNIIVPLFGGKAARAPYVFYYGLLLRRRT